MRRQFIGQGVRIRNLNLTRKAVACPTCGTEAKRHSLGHRWVREVSRTDPAILEITYSKHYCPQCQKHFNLSLEHIAPSRCNFTHRVIRTALYLLRRKDLTLNATQRVLSEKYHVQVPVSTIHEWTNLENYPA